MNCSDVCSHSLMFLLNNTGARFTNAHIVMRSFFLIAYEIQVNMRKRYEEYGERSRAYDQIMSVSEMGPRF